MATSVFMKADEVQELLGVSRSEAYRIMKKLNDDLKEKGFIVLSGRVSRKYLEEMIYSALVGVRFDVHCVISFLLLLVSFCCCQNCCFLIEIRA